MLLGLTQKRGKGGVLAKRAESSCPWVVGSCQRVIDKIRYTGCPREEGCWMGLEAQTIALERVSGWEGVRLSKIG